MSAIDESGVSGEQLRRRARHGYYAAISYADERIGDRARRARRRPACADDTIVVFTSDHGEMLGERGLWYKMAFFDPAARVPLIVRLPGRPAAAARGRAGLAARPGAHAARAVRARPVEGLHGRSLAPALTGGRGRRRPTSWRSTSRRA